MPPSRSPLTRSWTRTLNAGPGAAAARLVPARGAPWSPGDLELRHRRGGRRDGDELAALPLHEEGRGALVLAVLGELRAPARRGLPDGHVQREHRGADAVGAEVLRLVERLE